MTPLEARSSAAARIRHRNPNHEGLMEEISKLEARNLKLKNWSTSSRNRRLTLAGL
jgi:hypothetical protein